MEGANVRRISFALARRGFLALRFDFCGTDTSDGRFEDKLISEEMKDIKSAIDFLVNSHRAKYIVVFGHSTGATDAALYAWKDKRIKKLMLSGCIGDMRHSAHYDFTDVMVRDFWTKGYTTYLGKPPIGSKWWAHGKRLKKEYYDEFFKLDLLSSVHMYRGKTLVIQGSDDHGVPMWENTQELFQAIRKPKRLVIVKGAGHGYERPHEIGKVVQEIMKFLKEKHS